ncbi:WD40 repeat domain-containing protein [Streptomyces sp. NPDC057877]|uniref:NACHT and WD40 repeat domain-containing protein n=1 Tax=Streptomyces sp. NPDC057877 TaxID=3346269 RepID=UPI0036BD45AE
MSWLSSRLRQRRLRTALFLALAVISLGLAAVMLRNTLADGDSMASVVGLFVGLAGLGLSVADFLRGQGAASPDPEGLADDLAGILREQWLLEAESRKLRDPRVLPLVWSATRRNVSDHLDAIVPAGRGGPPPPHLPGARAGQPGRVVRLRLDGRLDGQFDEATARLAAGYRGISSGRLVVLGEPGAGKSVVAMLLALGLLDDSHRAPGGRVPVLLSVSSWDPISESLDHWLLRTLAESYYADRMEIPRTLLLHGLLLPVLDGLDEIPEAARRSAVRALNHALGQERPVVVTCRSVEYEDLIKAGSPALHRAPVVEIAPVDPEDTIRYLADVSWPAGTDWAPVYEQLRTCPDSPSALALSTPLIISMTRTVYERCGGSPGELIDESRFGSRHAVEDHLIERFVDAAYERELLPSGRPADGPDERPGPSAAKAREWLTFLALYLHQHRERDLAWWLMSQRLLSAWAAPGVGLGFGALLAVVTVFAMSLLGDDAKVVVGAVPGACFAVLTMLLWYATAGRSPGRPTLTLRGAGPRLRRGFTTGLFLTSVPAASVIGVMVLAALADGWGREGAATVLDVVMTALALIVVISCGIAAHECLDAPPGHAARADPVTSLQDDRRSALGGALATGTVVGLGAFPALVVGQALARLLDAALHGWSGEPSLQDRLTAQFRSEAARLGCYRDGEYAVAQLLAECFLLPGLVTASLILLSRAWTRFLLLRLVAAARGQLPWRFMGFLIDAHHRGVLRKSGGRYQFRHIRLQETLVARSPGATVPASGAPARRRPSFRALCMGAGAVFTALTVVLAAQVAFPEDTSTRTFVADYEVGVLQFDGDTLVASDGERLDRWDVTDGREKTSVSAPRNRLVSVKELVDAPAARKKIKALFQKENDVEFWDVRTGQSLGDRSLHGDWDGDEEWDADLDPIPWVGERPLVLLSTCGDPRYVWDLEGQRVVASVAHHHEVLGCSSMDLYALSPDRGVLAIIDDSANCVAEPWRTDTGSPRKKINVCRRDWDSPEFAVSNDAAHMVATGHGDGVIRFWDTRNGELLDVHTGHRNGGIIRMTFNADGSLLATHGVDGTVRLWETPLS